MDTGAPSERQFVGSNQTFDWSELPVAIVGDNSNDGIQKAVDNLSHGGTVYLDGELYEIGTTIRLPSKIRIQGRGPGKTVLRLVDGAGCHLFTNADYKKGNERNSFVDFMIDGNMEKQEKPQGVASLSFCCGVYFKTVRFVDVRSVQVRDIRQTGLHFNNCATVRISNYDARRVGWSGVSTSGTDDISIEGEVHQAGLDVLHSGIHLDGGHGAFFKGVVDTVTGNGIMLDSKYREFGLCKIDARVMRAKRGVSLSGDHQNELTNVLISGEFCDNRETGIMVSNAAHVVITDSKIRNNPDYGILFQGRNGGRECSVFHTEFSKNGLNIAELHQSGVNYFFGNVFHDGEKIKLTKSRPGVAGPKHLDRQVASQVARTAAPGPRKQQRTFERTVYEGLCAVCGEHGEFKREKYAIRETYFCQNCRASLRHRCQAEAILGWHGDSTCHSIANLANLESFRALSVYEPGLVGPYRREFSSLPSYHLSYFWEDCPTGEEREGIRNEDLMNLTYPDNRFDLIITSDIMEHIRRPYEAFGEIKRVLKPGGAHVFSIPVLDPLPKKTIYRVDTSGDEDINLLPPRYHIAGTGDKSLVYTEYGEDMIARLKDEVGVDVRLHRTHNESPPELRRVITFLMLKV